MELLVYPAIYLLWRRKELPSGGMHDASSVVSPEPAS
jgi:hypothetical protein